MFDHGHTRGAGVEHRQQGGEPLEGRAVADGRGQRDDRRAGQPGDDTGQRAVHPGRDNDDPGAAQQVNLVQDAVQTGHPDVDQCLGRPAEVGGGEFGFAGNRNVRGAGRDDEDEPTGRRGRCRRPGQQPRRDVVAGVGKHRHDGGRVLGFCPGEEGDRWLIADGAGDGGDLFRRLAGAVDRFGVPAAGCAVEIQGGDSGQRPRRGIVDRQPWRTWTSGRVKAPDWIPARSTTA